MKELLDLYFCFMKIGAVSFGGGYAMLPLITRELSDKRNFVSDTELNDYYAIGQVTPGIIAVNVATFIGNKRKGIAGGIAATLGLVTVPLIIISVIAAVLTNFAEIKLVQHAFGGIRVCVCVLIFNAITRLWKKSVTDAFALIIFLVVFAISAFGKYFLSFEISPVIPVIAAAISGIVIKSISYAAKQHKGDDK